MEPWEALDIDDSDLSSFLRPCKRHLHDSPPKSAAAANAPPQPPISQRNPHSSPETLISSHSLLPPPAFPNRLIPGPAGVLQAAMQRRALDRQILSEDAADSISTQEFVRRVVQNGDVNDDHDFNTNAWHSALSWLRREGMVDRDGVPFGTPFGSIKKQINIERVGQVIAVIKSCTPNGLGDLMVTLKDPSGTIGASVHRKVFTEGEFRNDIKAGSVLVLQKVAVFYPTRSVCYLNITLRNIVKIFSERSEPASEIYPTAARRTAPSIEGNEKVSIPDNTLSQPRERTKEINTIPSLHLGFKDMEAIDEQKGDDEALGSIGAKYSGSIRSQHVGIAEHVEALSGGELEIEIENQSRASQLSRDSSARIPQNDGSSAYLADASESQEMGSKKQMDTNREVLITKNSIPLWTEEQLDELFAFD